MILNDLAHLAVDSPAIPAYTEDIHHGLCGTQAGLSILTVCAMRGAQ
jgi:hypothetical protein